MQKAVETGNLVDLGRTLARLVVQTEFSITDGYYQTVNERTGRMEAFDTGLPFTRWRDALPFCAEALQETGYASDIDMADILQIKYLIMMRKPQGGHPPCQGGLRTQPTHLLLLLPHDPRSGYGGRAQVCQEGDEVQANHQVLALRYDEAGYRVCWESRNQAVGPPVCRGRERIGYRVFDECHGGCQGFHRECSPGFPSHARGRGLVHAHDFTLKGPELSMSLVDFEVSNSQHLFSGPSSSHCDHSLCWIKRDLAMEFLQRITGVTPSGKPGRLALGSLLKYMDVGNLEWGPPMMKINQLLANKWNYKHKNNPVPENVGRRMDELTAWLEKLDIEPDKPETTHCVNPKVNPNKVVLYRCTHCGNSQRCFEEVQVWESPVSTFSRLVFVLPNLGF
jgi:YD repeat-containing protein